MVIPGNLPSQLRVLDSSHQLYAPLFLASDSSSTNTLSLKTLRKTPQFLHNAVHSPFQKTSSRFSFFFFLLYLFSLSENLLCSFTMLSPLPFRKTSSSFPDLPFQQSLPQPHFSTPLLLQPPFLLSHPRPLNGLRDSDTWLKM